MAQHYGALEKFLRVGEGRRLKQLAKQADYITSLEPDFEALSDEELKGKTAEFKERLEDELVQLLPVLETLLELGGLSHELLVRERLEVGLE